jgi:hypothetical protein
MQAEAPPGVTITGYLEGPALSQAYASAHVFVFPSRVETLGNVVLVQDHVSFRAELRHVGFPGVRGVNVSMQVQQVAGVDGVALPAPVPYSPKDRALPSNPRSISWSASAQVTRRRPTAFFGGTCLRCGASP